MTDSLRLRLVYDGIGPVHWHRAPGAFGLQDKAGVLHVGTPGPGGVQVFDFALQVKAGSTGAPVFTGPFAQGPADGRFVYLSWRTPEGSYAQRLKLLLGSITWDGIRAAAAQQQPLVGTVLDHHPRATSTGANIGGTRAMVWGLG